MTCSTCHGNALILRDGAELPTRFREIAERYRCCPDCPSGREMQRQFDAEIAEMAKICADRSAA